MAINLLRAVTTVVVPTVLALGGGTAAAAAVIHRHNVTEGQAIAVVAPTNTATASHPAITLSPAAANSSAAKPVSQSAGPVKVAPAAPAPTIPAMKALGFNPTVGALFAGGSHFCSASVVDSLAGDLVLTAGHCAYGGSIPGYHTGLSFAPGYHDGLAPYGMWKVTSELVSPGWISSADPNLDFAFLTVSQPGNPVPIESVTGANQLGIDQGFVNQVTLSGYPDTTSSPTVCRNGTTQFGSDQQRIVCAGFPDGTSGGPWVINASPVTGEGMVIGVIGGYELGGDSPDVSYSAYFDSDIQELYNRAAN